MIGWPKFAGQNIQLGLSPARVREYDAALAGLGIARLPTYLIAQDIAEGRLINLLPELADSASNIYAVYMMKQNMSPKIRVFLDFLAIKFRLVPPWERTDNTIN